MSREHEVVGHVFLSYAREDAARVDELQEALEAAQVPVWRDTASLWPGEDWQAVIRREISGGALVFLACFSTRSVKRSEGFQYWELQLAVEQMRARRPGVPWLIPVRLDECEIPDLDLGGGRSLASIQRVDLFGARADRSHARLIDALQRVLRQGGGADDRSAGLLAGPSGAPRWAASADQARVVVGEVPQEPTAFQARPDLLARLTVQGARVPVVFAVTGLRGVGKSQLAAALARRRLEQGWPVVAWLDAGDRQGLLAGYARLAAALGLADDGPDSEADSETAAERVRHRLETDGHGCLIVLDNAVTADILRPFLPAAGKSQVIVTSSRTAMAAIGLAVPVDIFTAEEATQFLAERTGLDDPTGAAAVSEELGRLPLALAQAGAVIAGQRLSYATYLRRLAEVTVEEYLMRHEEDPYPRGTAQAITLALDASRATDASGLGQRMLTVLSVLSPAGVPRSLIAAAVGTGEATADGVLGHLAGWSVISFSLDGRAVLAHRLVLRVLREQAFRSGSLASASEDAINALLAMLPGQEDAWQEPDLMRECVSQITTLARHLDTHIGLFEGLDRVKFLNLLARAGWYLTEISDLPQAIPLIGRLLADRLQLLGSDHPDTLDSRGNLALLYRAAGQFDEAIALHQQNLTDRQRILGPDNPNTLASRRNLAYAYLDAGQLDQAIKLLELNLSDRQRVLGPDHPDTLASRSNLAYAYLLGRQFDQAITSFEQTLADHRRLLGSDDANTLGSGSDLAYALRTAGQLTQAIALYTATLSDYERALGPDHHLASTCRTNLALAYQTAGQLNQAISLLEQNLSDRQRVLGPNHRHTLASRNDLALAYQADGQLDRAIALHQQNRGDRQRALGSDHPDTLASRRNLASALQVNGQLDQAIALYRTTLSDCERALGSSHRLTNTVRQDLSAAEGTI